MPNALATSDIALAPAQETPKQARRVTDAPAPTGANNSTFFDVSDYEVFEPHRPVRGILLGVVLGALCWAGLIALFVAL